MTTGDDSAFNFLELTRTQRLLGFGICLVAGFGLSLLGAISYVRKQEPIFAVLYVVGVVCAVVGTGFLFGFKRQVNMMRDPVRQYAAAVFLLCVALTWMYVFAISIKVRLIVFAICIYLAYGRDNAN
ncbi:Got1/Sft2-like family vesicle transport protein [Rhodotorula paludigena]|uniref:Got1/Sft2-like family vesicle transport protein n=1 Tax=Rhodotorula paludigena TaxID=86838 RepID=UPI0031766435